LTAIVLALGSSLCWGMADFFGGLLSRRIPVLLVILLSQAAALAIVGVVAAAGVGGEYDAEGLAWAAAAGSIGVIALAAFYRGLAVGTMSIVAPLSATGAAVPVIVGIALGERPAAIQLAGMFVAVVGVMLASREAPSAEEEERRAGRAAVGLAFVAALGFGSFFVGVDQARESVDALWVLVAARSAGVALLLVAFVALRPPLPAERRRLVPVLAVGVVDLIANALFVLAVAEGLLSVVGVLGSLYPVATVLMARTFLHERVTRVQEVGVVATLAGVIAISAG
jgi:drug/metabolite transporter (DMT)-like permease